MKKWIFLLRSFFPKWVFFDVVGSELKLEVSYGASETTLSEWTNALSPIERSFKNLLINSSGNYLHACHNHLSLFYSEISVLDEGKADSILEMTSFRITGNMARFQIEERKLIDGHFLFKFRLVAVASDKSHEPQLVMTSPLLEAR